LTCRNAIITWTGFRQKKEKNLLNRF
jgi:hypothetical protein